MNNSKEYIRQRWGNGLYKSLASEGLSEKECSRLSDVFDKWTEQAGINPESACKLLLSAHAAQNAKPLLNQIANWIHTELEFFNVSGPKIEVNPVLRLRDIARRQRDNLSKVNIVVNGQEYSEKQLDDIRKEAEMKIPACMQQTLYEATANENSKAKFSMTVIL